MKCYGIWNTHFGIIKLYEDDSISDYYGCDKGHFYWSNFYDKNNNMIISLNRHTSIKEGMKHLNSEFGDNYESIS